MGLTGDEDGDLPSKDVTMPRAVAPTRNKTPTRPMIVKPKAGGAISVRSRIKARIARAIDSAIVTIDLVNGWESVKNRTVISYGV